MTGDTANAFVEVEAVIEVGKIRQIIHSGPGKRLSRLETVPHWGQEGTLSPDIGEAIHTGSSGRHPGKGADFYRGVTIAAVNTKSADVMLMTELHRLLACYTLLSGVAGPVQRRHEPEQPSQNKHRTQNAHARDGVRTRMEDLR